MAKRRRWWWWGGAIVASAVVIAIVWSLLPVGEWATALIKRIDDLGAWGMVAYCGLYVALACLTFPSTPLNVGAGVIFSYPIGYATALAASAITSSITFLVARFVARDWIDRKVKKLDGAEDVLRVVAEEGFKAVFLARINPFVPASLKNYGFGITSMSFAKYLGATVAGQSLIVAAHVYLGWAGGTAMMHGDNELGAVDYALIGAGVVASILTLIGVTWYGSRKLKNG